jgi:TetR/AcrR family transcriptional regulator
MEPLDKRSNLLQVALELFAAQGYEAVGVQEIVEAAKITKPTLYYYFGSKYGLLETLLTEQFDRFFKQVHPTTIYHGDLTLNITQIVTAYFNFARTNQTFYRFQLSLGFAPVASEPYKIIAKLNERQIQPIEELFKNAVRDHGNMRGRHLAYAVTFVGMINSYIIMWLNGYVQLDDALIYPLTHQFMHGIFS